MAFTLNTDGSITMHRGDTGAVWVRAARGDEEDWTEYDRMMFTVRNQTGEIVMQRYYRLDTDVGNGICLIQFHNSDTDTWDNGTYDTERRYMINPIWNGTAPTSNVVNALTAGVRIVDGVPVRIPNNGQSTLTIMDIYGEV